MLFLNIFSASPTITQAPPETLTVEEGETVTVVCTAVGNPTPIISWRLNWGNIPPGPRVSVTSENGRGTVTIRDARQSDQGAWSCEAINSKDSVLAVPDTILVVKRMFLFILFRKYFASLWNFLLNYVCRIFKD